MKFLNFLLKQKKESNMKVEKLLDNLKKLNEQEVMFTPQKLRDIINDITIEDIELEEDEQINITKIPTLYNTYKAYGLEYDDILVMPMGDYKHYIKDVCQEYTTILPDGFEQFFNLDALTHNAEQDNYYVIQAIKQINEIEDKDYYGYERVQSGTIDGIEYQLLKEIIL